ncbi:MAG: response regulator transcription factor [Bdellovibrionales bacterium]|nr:response regulator transcription factor [Bdellovibrionales bacterium]
MARILVVDDDKDILRLAQRVLATANHDVFVAGDAYKAMEYLDSTDFDALITDANMPHFSGFDLISTLKNQRKHTGMAIAMLTGLRERKDIERAMKIGVDDYIVKPLDPLLFLQKVEALFIAKPAIQRPEVNFPEASEQATAQMNIQIEITQISELGVVLATPFLLEEGAVVDVNCSIFNEFGVKTPPLKVGRSQKRSDGKWEARAHYLGATEAFLQKVRAYVLFPAKRKQPAVSSRLAG